MGLFGFGVGDVRFSRSIDTAFLVGAAVLVVAFLFLLFRPRVRRRTRSAAAAASPPGERPDAGPTGPIGPPGRHVRPPGPDRRRAPVTATVAAPPFEAPPEHADGGNHNGVAATSAIPAANAVLTGHVTGPDGRPLRATLTVTDIGARQIERGETGGDGGYRIAVPAGGTYLMIFAAEHHQPAASMVVAAAPEAVHDVTLSGAARIEGRVSGPAGDAIAGAVVTATDARGEVVGVAIADHDGRYVIGDLYPAQYTVAATADHALPNARGVTIGTDGSRVVDLVLAANGTLGGTVRASRTGRPVGEASVTLVDAAGNVVAAGVTADDGRYDFGDLAPGRYVLTAAGYAPAAARVEVDSERTAFDIVLGPPGEGAAVPARLPGAASDGVDSSGGGTARIAYETGPVR